MLYYRDEMTGPEVTVVSHAGAASRTTRVAPGRLRVADVAPYVRPDGLHSCAAPRRSATRSPISSLEAGVDGSRVRVERFGASG